MIVSHTNRFIFFKPLKTAGTSIEAFLSRSCLECDLVTGPAPTDNTEIDPEYRQINNLDTNGSQRFHGHTYPEMLYTKTQNSWNDYFKISCVRNPWDLCVSYYWWCTWLDFKQFSEKDLVISASDSYACVIRKFKKFMFSPVNMGEENCDGPESFNSTLDFLSRDSSRFITPDINAYIRFENLEGDLEKVCNSVGLQFGKIPRFKSLQRKLPLHYTEYYDNMTKKIVEEKFKTSIDKFKYYF